MKGNLRYIVSALMTITLLLGCISPYTVKAAVSETDIASFLFTRPSGAEADKDLNDTYKTNADSGYYASSGRYKTSARFYASVSGSSSNNRKLEWSADNDYSFNGLNQKATPIMAAGNNNPWGNAPYFLLSAQTTGYENLKISFRIGGSKKGPKAYKVQYSTDNKTFTDISGTAFSLTTNKVLYEHSFGIPSAASNRSMVYIRIIAAGTQTISGGKLSDETTGGEAAINNISLKGTAITASPSKATPAPTAKAAQNNNSSGQNAATDSKASDSTAKKLTAPALTSYKKGKKVIKGTSLKKSKVTVTVGSKKYTVKTNKKGKFTVKLKKKLKKGTVIKVYASKSGYITSTIRTYKV